MIRGPLADMEGWVRDHPRAGWGNLLKSLPKVPLEGPTRVPPGIHGREDGRVVGPPVSTLPGLSWGRDGRTGTLASYRERAHHTPRPHLTPPSSGLTTDPDFPEVETDGRMTESKGRGVSRTPRRTRTHFHLPKGRDGWCRSSRRLEGTLKRSGRPSSIEDPSGVGVHGG